MELIRLDNVSKEYDKTGGNILERVDLTVNGGDYISVQGVSGSGKSTLLLIMSGLLKPTTGSVYYQNKDIYTLNDNELSEWRGKSVGYLYQNVQMARALTLRENMRLCMKLGNDPKGDVEELISLLGLEECADKLPGKISGGQRRRAMIGCVMARKPLVILADEPTNDLDARWAKKIMLFLKEQTTEDRALVLVTHDPKWASDAPKRYYLNEGKLEQNTNLLV